MDLSGDVPVFWNVSGSTADSPALWVPRSSSAGASTSRGAAIVNVPLVESGD
jgi:hypothetical protein